LTFPLLININCECGGRVVVNKCLVPAQPGKAAHYEIDGGTCISCLKEVILPPEEYGSFVARNCEQVDIQFNIY
jgi:hypothetical protein